jgi:hypothetical protein
MIARTLVGQMVRWCFQQLPKGCRDLLISVIYLQDEAVTIEGLRFYGSPWQPRFFDWAFESVRVVYSATALRV